MQTRQSEPEPPPGAVGSRLLEAVAGALQLLVAPGSLGEKLSVALEAVGRAADADRVYVFENRRDENGDLLMNQRYEWARDTVSVQIDNPELQNLPYPNLPRRWDSTLSANGTINLTASMFTGSEHEYLGPQGILSLLVVPIFVDDQFWGFVGFDDCRTEREWMPHEIATLRACASGIAAAIRRSRVDAANAAAVAKLERQAEELRLSRSVSLSLIEDAKRAEAAAEAANEAKSDFLAVMSHEMRTPLNAILGFTDLILANEPSPPIDEYAATIVASGKHLLALINDVLDFAKIESGNISLDPLPASPRSVAEEVVASFRRSAENKRLSLDLEVSEGVPEFVRIDPTRFGQILLNLVGNAIKFTESGGVRVTLDTGVSRSGEPNLRCEVSDTGIGIDPEALGRIFQPFTQAAPSVHRKFGGTGLGLPISRRLCELMGGALSVASLPGEGSTFTFDVLASPCDDVGSTGLARGERYDIERLADCVPLDILVVDDVAANRMLLAAILRKMGYEPDLVESGEAACEAASTRDFDLILMDVLMPGLDGCEAAAKILQDARAGAGKAPVIVALSADAMEANRERCLAAGMSGFLTKPIRIDQLAGTVRALSSGGTSSVTA